MLSTTTQLTALFTNASDLRAAISNQTFTVSAAEVWAIGGNITYPALAFTIDVSNSRIPAPISDRESGTLRIWFVSKRSLTDCHRMRDALSSKLHRQHQSLALSGALSVQYLSLTHSHVGIVPETGEYQAYLTFEIVV